MNNDVNAKWPKLPVALKKIAIDPTSDDYELMCSNYFVTGRPKLILRATTERDVI
ncbi:FAD-binding oxidoreductase, partial [Lacticaseibacillus paracasei]